MHTLRNVLTYLKNLKPKVSRNTEAYFWPQRHEIVNPSRFDTIEKAVKKETHKNLFNTKYNSMMKEINYPTLNRNASVVNAKSSVGITPFEIKMQLMKGSSNILGKVHMNDPVTSSYQHIFKGLATRYSNKPIDLDIC